MPRRGSDDTSVVGMLVCNSLMGSGPTNRSSSPDVSVDVRLRKPWLPPRARRQSAGPSSARRPPRIANCPAASAARHQFAPRVSAERSLKRAPAERVQRSRPELLTVVSSLVPPAVPYPSAIRRPAKPRWRATVGAE
jgi:hypothetical protein